MRCLRDAAAFFFLFLPWYALSAPGQHIPSPSDAQFAGRLQCGPASMAIAMRRLGVDVTDEELRELETADGFSTFEDLARFAAVKGVHARTVRMDIEDLRGLRQTAILQVRYRRTTDTEPMDHFVVYAGYAADGSAALILDPEAAGGRGLVPMERLASRWTGMALVFGGDPAVVGRNVVMRTGVAFGAFVIVFAAVLIIARRSRRALPAAVALVLTATVAPAVRGQTSEGPPEPTLRDIIVSRSAECDLGQLPFGTVPQVRFELANDTQTMVLPHVTNMSCGCLAADVLLQPTSPGDAWSLTVTVKPERAGRFRQTVEVQLIPTAERRTLIVHGSMIGDIRATPDKLRFEMARPGSLLTRYINVTAWLPDGEVLRIKPQSSRLATAGVPRIGEIEYDDPVLLSDGTTRWGSRIEVTAIADEPGARASGVLSFVMHLGGRQYDLHVPYVVSCLRAVRVTPERVLLIPNAAGTASAIVRVVARDPSTEVTLRMAEEANEGVSDLVACTIVSRGADAVLRIELNPGVEGDQQLLLRCRYEVAEESGVLEIPVRIGGLRRASEP